MSEPTPAPAAPAFPSGAEILSIGLVAIGTLVWMTVSLLVLPVLQNWAKNRGMLLPGPMQLQVDVTSTFGHALWLLAAVPVAVGLAARTHRLRERLVVGLSLLLLAALVTGLSLFGVSVLMLQFG